VTYRVRRCFPAALPVLFDKRGIAMNIFRVALAIAFLVLSPGSIHFLLLLVNAAKIIRMLRSPLLIGLTFLLSPTFFAAAGCLSLFEARIRSIYMAAMRAPPLLWHKDSSPGLQDLVRTMVEVPKHMESAGRREKPEKKKGKAISKTE
jgi:hypothetical protein